MIEPEFITCPKCEYTMAALAKIPCPDNVPGCAVLHKAVRCPSCARKEKAEESTEKEAAKPQVKALPCPKCGSDDTFLVYSGKGCYYSGANEVTRQATGEHFHRNCYNCQCSWITYDTLKDS